jgi:hypothetical protein
MTTLDEYEQRRGPVRRRAFNGRKPGRKTPGKNSDPREVQMALKLMGGTTAKDRGEPFDDDIDFIGRS